MNDYEREIKELHDTIDALVRERLESRSMIVALKNDIQLLRNNIRRWEDAGKAYYKQAIDIYDAQIACRAVAAMRDGDIDALEKALGIK